jgi:hypothetical protein
MDVFSKGKEKVYGHPRKEGSKNQNDKERLVYSDLNGDGLKDISYINSSITPYYMIQNNELFGFQQLSSYLNNYDKVEHYMFLQSD